MKIIIRIYIAFLLCLIVVACGSGEKSPAEKSDQEVKIFSPENNAVYTNDEDIEFSINPEAAESEEIKTDSIVWHSSINGEIGREVSINVRLTVGEHLITMSVKDVYDYIHEDSISLVVNSTLIEGVTNIPPVVTISSPNGREIYKSDVGISFIGEASDAEDTNINESLIWYSNIDGVIGVGKNVVKKLSPSPHLITLVAEDSDGNKTSASVNISVIANDDLNPDVTPPDGGENPSNNPPSAHITSPKNGALFLVNENINFKGFGSDVEDISLPDSRLAWYSDIDDSLGFGKDVNTTLKQGVHKISLLVTDSESSTASDSIYVTVAEKQNTFHLNGKVISDNPLENVSVFVGLQQTVTDGKGFYSFEDIVVPDDGEVVITFFKLGYIIHELRLSVEAGETYVKSANLQRYVYSELKDFSTAVHMNIIDPNNPESSSLAMLDFPIGSISEARQYYINVLVGDASLSAEREIFPGNFIGVDDNNNNIKLEPHVFALINLTTLQLMPVYDLENAGSLTLRLADSYQIGGNNFGQFIADDPVRGKIPWWSYDRQVGKWISRDANLLTPEVDPAKVIVNGEGVLYVQGDMTEFTWWAAAESINDEDEACLCATITDADNIPLVGKNLIAEGISYFGQSESARTDDKGEACLLVKRTTNPLNSEYVKIYGLSGSVKFPYDVTSSLEGNHESDEIITPSTVGDVDARSSCVTLENNLVIDETGQITGRITSERTGEPLEGIRIFNNLGGSLVSDGLGRFTLLVPFDTPISFWNNMIGNQEVTVTQDNPVKHIELIKPNHTPVIDEFSKNPLGLIVNEGSVLLSVSASDPDNDELSYLWHLSGGGTLNTTNGEVVSWTAPSTGAGVATLIADVSDGHKSTSYRTEIVWGGSVGSSNFQIQFKDNRVTNRPVRGVTTILHDVNNKTFLQENVKTSDENGLVNFGDIGRYRGTISIDRESVFSRHISTYVDVPLGSLIYYVDESVFDYSRCDISQTNINVSMNNPHGHLASKWEVMPLGKAGIGSALDPERILVCNANIQSDKKLSMLATSRNQSGDIVSYGYLLDQDLEENGSYYIDLDKTPSSITLVSDNGLLNEVSIKGIRKDQEYLFEYSGFGSDTTPTIEFPMGFPVEKYSIYSAFKQNASNTTIRSRNYVPLLPQVMNLQVPDFKFDDVDFDQSSQTFEWLYTGSKENNLVGLFIESRAPIYDVYWRVWLPALTSRWEVVDLPKPALGYEDAVLNASINVITLDAINDHEGFWKLLSTGHMLDDVISSGYAVGTRQFSILE